MIYPAYRWGGGYTKSEVDTLLNDYIPKSGGTVISGTSLGRTDNTSSITFCGGTDNSKGGSITIYGKDRTNNNGEFSLVANDGTSSSELCGKPNGTLSWGNKKVDTIEEQGDGYIRYANGLQICWGILNWQSDCVTIAWGSLYETSDVSGSYAKSFIEIPFFSASGNIGGSSAMIDSNTGTKTSTPQVWLCRAVSINEVKTCTIRYIAIGRWK